MLKASWKSLWARKLALMLSTVAIVLGTAFVAGAYTFTDMLDSAFKGIFSGAVSDVNVQTKGADTSLAMGGTNRQLRAQDVDKVSRVEGVQSAYGLIADPISTFVLDKKGKSMSMGAPGMGLNYIDAPAMGGQPGLVVKTGRAPKGEGEVMIDPQSLSKGGYALGDKVKIVTPGKVGTIEPTVVGTAVYGAKGSTGGASYAIFDTPYAQKIYLEGADAFHGVWVTVEPGADPKQVADRMAALMPDGFEAKTGQDVSDNLNKAMAGQMKFITYFLLIFAAIALLVGSFLIFNTFSILVAQRGREMALMRAMGASRGQITGSVFFEAVFMGLIGSIGGLFFGFVLAFGISQLFGTLGLDISGVGMRLTWSAVIATFAVGLLVTLVAAMVPAVRAGRVPPVAAMSGDMMTGKTGLGWRIVGGGIVLSAGVVLFLLALFKDSLDNRMGFLGVGALLTFLGVAALSPILGAPVIWGVGQVNKALFGTVGRLAEVNAARNPRRTAVTASALMIGLALVTSLGTLGASMKASTQETVTKALRGDFVVQNPTQMPFTSAAGDAIAKVSGVAAAHRVSHAPGRLDGDDAYFAAIDAGSFDKIIKQTMVRGNLADFRGDAMLVDEGSAEKAKNKVGDTVTVHLNGRDIPVKVVGVFATEKNAGIGHRILTRETLQKTGLLLQDSMVTVNVAGGADKQKVREALDKAVADLPMVTVADQEEYAKAQSAGIDQLLYLLYALLGLAIVIAIFGIVNTLGLSIIERTREIGLLRAVGLNKGQIRTMVTLESVTIALLGSVLGIVLGLAFGVGIQQGLADEGLKQLVLPWGQIAISLIVALMVGVLAGLWPAMRANKLDVLKAIAAD
ncbi:ABC transporter permease [Austwickia chelonae]|uniref:ABC transporter permease n=1 Tax=Austwickia chelonae TaxID=100225 RepID=UPI000E2451B8|nr:ABC transporter permease [Austwickia chelonae]